MHTANSPLVMVADHSEDTREMLRFWLEAEGCCVVEAVNGRRQSCWPVANVLI
jgi:CheY-like chemotaxis protein